MPSRNLRDQLINVLQGQIPLLKPKAELEDLKRSKYRKVDLYTINDINEIECDEDYPDTIRYVVTNAYQLVLARAGRPSKYIPQHREMSKSAECIAAGKLILSNETPKRVIGINYQTSDYSPNMASLLWPLTILVRHASLIHPDFYIQIFHVDASQKVISAEKIPMNAQALHGFLEEVWEHCPIQHAALRAMIFAADGQARRDTIIDEEPMQSFPIFDTPFDHYFGQDELVRRIRLDTAVLARNREELPVRILRAAASFSDARKRGFGLFGSTDSLGHTSIETSDEEPQKIARNRSSSYISDDTSSEDNAEIIAINAKL
ncbi:MAG: hypothetical protein NTU48_02950 [Legionellales bacterium]|nr:hypothetical protein [Legionellales bacterium]